MPGNEGVADGGVAADGAGGGGENNLSVGSVGVGSHWSTIINIIKIVNISITNLLFVN